MGNININDELHEELRQDYSKQDKLKYPTLKNYTEQMIKRSINGNS